MSHFSRPHPDSANNRPRLSPADNTPIASRTLSESSVVAYSDESAPAYSLVYVPESERGLQAVPRSLLPWRIVPQETHQEDPCTATAYHYLLMAILVRVIAASIAFCNSAALSTDGTDDAGVYIRNDDASDEGHVLRVDPKQPRAPGDSDPVTEARPSTTTRGGSGRASHKRRPDSEDTGNAASSPMDAERGGMEGHSDDDGETL